MESLEATEREVALHGTLAALTKCVWPCRRMRTACITTYVSSKPLVWPHAPACLRKPGATGRWTVNLRAHYGDSTQRCLRLAFALCRSQATYASRVVLAWDRSAVKPYGSTGSSAVGLACTGCGPQSRRSPMTRRPSSMSWFGPIPLPVCWYSGARRTGRRDQVPCMYSSARVDRARTQDHVRQLARRLQLPQTASTRCVLCRVLALGTPLQGVQRRGNPVVAYTIPVE